MAADTTESTESTSTAPVESASEASAPESAPPSPPSDAQDSKDPVVVKPDTPSYSSDYKFKAYDKEYDIPEMYRTIIKDENSEKDVKQIFAKAYALDQHKTIHEGLKNQFKTYQEQTEPLLKIAQELDYYQKKGDLGSYFATLGFTDQQIMEYALQKAQQLELSPEQKRVYDERELANRQQYMLETQFQQTQERLQNLMIQQRQVELQNVLSKPDIQSFAQAFDGRHGQGAFAQECVQQGRSHFALTGQDLSADEVVQGIVKKFSPLMAQTQMAPQQSQAPRAPADVPVIPNTGSSGGSPTTRAVRSIDDLKRIANEKFANDLR